MHEAHPVLDEPGIDLAGCGGRYRGVEAECGPDAHAEKAPTAEGVHVFSSLVPGAPGYRGDGHSQHVRDVADLVDREAPPAGLDAAYGGLAHVQPAGDEGLRQPLAVERMATVGTDHLSDVPARERGGHRLGLPELGGHF